MSLTCSSSRRTADSFCSDVTASRSRTWPATTSCVVTPRSPSTVWCSPIPRSSPSIPSVYSTLPQHCSRPRHQAWPTGQSRRRPTTRRCASAVRSPDRPVPGCVKHKAARMLALAEQARVCAWDAARALTPANGVGAEEASLAAAVAGATALEAGFSVTRDCIQVLGGIGYTWEHDAHLYLRRAQVPANSAGFHGILASSRCRADHCRHPSRAQRRAAARGRGDPSRRPSRARSCTRTRRPPPRKRISRKRATPHRTSRLRGANPPMPSASWSSPKSCALRRSSRTT